MENGGKSGDSGDGGSNTNPQEVTIEVDGEKKTYKAEDIQNLVAQQASATQKTQKVAALIAAAEKYGLEPEDYVGRSEGAFATIVDLMEEGVLDEEGKRILKKEESDDSEKGKAKLLEKQKGKVESKGLDMVTEALDKIEKRTQRLEEDGLNFMKKDLSREIRKKHPELGKDDVSKLFAVAMANPRKDVWQHAEEFAGKKKEGKVTTRAEYAKEFGIDLKEWDENKVNEQDANGGGAASILGERKVSFKKGKGSISPREATLNYFRRIDKK